MVDIPVFLRQPIRATLTESAVEIWRQNPTETGPAVHRKLYDNAPSMFSVTWLLDEIEFAAFEGWFKTQINQGSDSFTMELLTGLGLVDHDVFFNPRNYKARPVGKRTRVTARILAKQKQFDTDANIQVLIDYLQDLFDAGDPRPSNTTLRLTSFVQNEWPDLWAQFL